jgi:hypothetical protein
MPARAAPLWPMPGMPLRKSAVMLTIAPPCCCMLWLKTSRIIRKPPVRLLATTASKPFLLMAISGAGNCPPALLTRPCTAVARHDGGHAGLHGVFVADVEGQRVAAAAVLGDLGGHTVQLVGVRPLMTTCAPSAGQFVRHAAADAAAAAGDPHHLAGEQAGRKTLR